MQPLFTDDDVRRLERTHPDGVSATAVVELLKQRGIDLAEATFRKYVQLGLLPRSKRVGRKGKHRGSHGLYPVACVGRVAEIRQLMNAGLTLEDIQRSSVALRFEVDALRRTADDILSRLEEESSARGNGKAVPHARRLQSLRVQADALAAELEQVSRDICPPTPAGEAQGDTASEARKAAAALRGRRPARALAAAGRVGRKSKNGSRAGHGRAGADR